MNRISTVAMSGLLALTLLPLCLATPSTKASASAAPSSSHAKTSQRVVARIKLAPDLSRLDGVASITLTNTSSATLIRLPVWLFPNRLSKKNPQFNEVNQDWIFPEAFSPGRMILRRVHRSGINLAVENTASSVVAQVTLDRPLKPGANVTLHFEFETHVPHRFGPFGHANGALTLDGGFLPRLPPLGPSGFRLDAPPDKVSYEFHARWLGPKAASPALVVLNGRVTKLPPDAKHHFLGRGEGRRLTFTVQPEHHVSVMKVDGTVVALYHRRPRRPQPDNGVGFKDLGVIDTHAHILASVALGLRQHQRALKVAGAKHTPPDRLVVVEASLRRDIAIAGENVVLVSDRAFELMEIERLLKFHRVAIVRRVLGVLLEPAIGPEHPLDVRDQVVDMAALDGALRWEQYAYGAADSAQELLSGGSFVALVDEALYAPQLPFQNVYFASVDDTDRLRDRFMLFSHQAPSGRRWLEKLRDRAEASGGPPSSIARAKSARAKGRQRLQRAMDRLVAGAGLSDALSGVPGVSVADLKQWDGPYPAVNYVLEKTEAARDADGHFVDVTVRRKGEQRKEPVTLKVTDADGGAALGRWDGETETGTVHVRTKAPADKVVLDPYSRLPDQDLGENIDPRRDNRDFETWKFIVEGFSFSVSSVEGRLEAALIAFLAPQNDLTHLIRLEPYELANRTGLFAGYYHYFGPKVRPNKRRFHISTSLKAEWLKGTVESPDGLGVQLAVGFGDFDQRSKVNPSKSHNLYASVAAAMAYKGGTPDLSGSVKIGYARVESPLDGHKLGFKVEASTLFGAPSPQQLSGLGGADAVRAFDPLAQTGRHRLLLMAEWRHRFDRDLSVNVAQLGFLTSVEGVLFVDAALLSKTYDDFFDVGSLYVGVGYGLRFFYLLVGMNPMLVRIDLAYPIFVGTPVATKSAFPLSFILSIDQAF